MDQGSSRQSATQTVRFRIEMLGRFAVIFDGTVSSQFRTQRTAALLAFLALSPKKSFSREFLAEVIWPEADESAAKLSLRVALSSIRQQFGSQILSTSRTSVQINRDQVLTDVDEFYRFLEQANRENEPRAKIAAQKQACDLYKGPLLPQIYDEWASQERHGMSWRHLQTANELADGLAKEGDLASAVAFARICAAEDQFDERAAEQLVRLLLEAGRAQQAGAYYEEFKTRLRRELGLAPSEELAALGSQLPAAASFLTDPQLARPRELPLNLTKFVGREADLQWIKAFLTTGGGSSRLVTILGFGGYGKTRLMVEAARQLWFEFPGAICFVDLSGLRDSRRIVDTICTAMGIVANEISDPFSRICQEIGGREFLLLLDNLEQLIDEEPNGVESLLALLDRLPALRIVTTSRQALGLEGETIYQLGPFRLPDSREDQRVDFATEGANSCLSLFVDRARLAMPGFELNEENFDTVVQICRRLEGSPLAIELAAAWLRTLSPSQILANLGEPHFPSSRRRGVPQRHQSLGDTIAWSFDLLSPQLQRLVQELAVFRGGFTVKAADAICEFEDVLVGLADLQERSLLSIQPNLDSDRMNLVESVREFAEENASADLKYEAFRRHAVYFKELAADVRSNLDSPGETFEIMRLQVEEENLRRALNWSLEQDAPLAADILRSLARYWEVTYRSEEAVEWFSRLNLESVADRTDRVETEIFCARHHLRLNHNSESTAILDRCLPVCRSLGRQDLEAKTLYLLAHLALNVNDLSLGRDYFDLAIPLFDQLGSKKESAACLLNLSEVEIRSGDLRRARAYAERATKEYEEADDIRGLLVAVGNLAEVALKSGSYSESKQLYERELSLCEKISDRFWMGISHYGLGQLEMASQNFEEARTEFERSIQLFQEISSEEEILMVECDLARLDRLQGHLEGAMSRYHKIIDLAALESVTSLRAKTGKAGLLVDRGEIDLGRTILKECLSLAARLNYAAETLDLLDEVTQYFQRIGQGEDADWIGQCAFELRKRCGFNAPRAEDRGNSGTDATRGKEFSELCGEAEAKLTSALDSYR